MDESKDLVMFDTSLVLEFLKDNTMILHTSQLQWVMEVPLF